MHIDPAVPTYAAPGPATGTAAAREERARFFGGVQRTGPLQSGLAQLEWLSYQSGGHGRLPNLSWVVPVPPGTADDGVEAVVHALLLRHEVLRTSFDADGTGQPRQCVHTGVAAPLPLVEDGPARLRFTEEPFEIATEPPVRFGRTPEGDLLLVVAHIAADGLGAWILVDDLTELLAARTEHRDAGLDAAVPQPVDRALHERQGGRRRTEAALRYWETALRDFPATALPVSRGRPDADVVRADLESPAARQALAVLYRRFGATPASAFTAAVFTALAVQFHRDRLGLSLTWSFREYPDTRDLVAAVFRDMPLIVDLGGEPSFSEVLRRLQHAVLLSGRHMGFDVLEFHECAGRIEAQRGSFLPGPESVSCILDGIDWKTAETTADPRDLLPESRLALERTNGFADVCNLYVSAYPQDGRLHIHSRIDASVVGAGKADGLVRLVEAVLVHAAGSGDLTFREAHALAVDPWHPGPRWARADGVWVDLDFLAARLREHPGVRQADVHDEDGRLTAHVDADLQPWELHDFLLSTDSGRGAVLSPRHFVITRTDGTSVSSPASASVSGPERPEAPPRGSAAQALADAIAGANNLDRPTMADTYLTLGGRLHHTPRVLSLLRDAGYEGLSIEDLRRPTSLRTLSGRLRPTSVKGDCQE